MDIERAIGIIEKVFTTDLAGTFALEQKQCIINLIRRGEKYEAMWKEFQKDNYRKHYSLTQLMYDFEQKYFPKIKKNIRIIKIEIEGEDNVDLGLAKMIMKKALTDWDFKKDIKFKEISNEIKMG